MASKRTELNSKEQWLINCLKSCGINVEEILQRKLEALRNQTNTDDSSLRLNILASLVAQYDIKLKKTTNENEYLYVNGKPVSAWDTKHNTPVDLTGQGEG